MNSRAAHTLNQEDFRIKVLRAGQRCLESFPVIVLGSGASAAYGVRGMPELQRYIQSTVTPLEADADSWAEFEHALTETNDLEAALQRVRLPEQLLEDVTRATRTCILADDLAVFQKLVLRELTLPLSRLYQHLIRSTHTTLSVVTTNYDRLAEFAADTARLPWYTGFSRGILRFFGPRLITQQRLSAENRTVEIWKVHGSIDWFSDPDGVAFALPYGESLPSGLTPLLVTPGAMKYEATHQEPFRTIIGNADTALANARSYLCLGYGFSDMHVHPKLVERVRDYTIPVVILAKQLTTSAKAFLTKCTRAPFLALEEAGSSTRVYSPDAPNGHLIDHPKLWQLDAFLDAIIGSA